MNLVARYRQWRSAHHDAALQASRDALTEAHIKRQYLLRIGQVCVDQKEQFVGNLVCDMLDKNSLQIYLLERKIQKFTRLPSGPDIPNTK